VYTKEQPSPIKKTADVIHRKGEELDAFEKWIWIIGCFKGGHVILQIRTQLQESFLFICLILYLQYNGEDPQLFKYAKISHNREITFGSQKAEAEKERLETVPP